MRDRTKLGEASPRCRSTLGSLSGIETKLESQSSPKFFELGPGTGSVGLSQNSMENSRPGVLRNPEFRI